MAYVQVPKDLTKVKTKVMFNLTKRQLVCFGSGGAIGVGIYFLTKNALGTTTAATIMILLVLPFFMFAVYEKDGRPLEKVLMDVIRTKFLVPGIRPYQTENMYAVIQREIKEQEVLGIGTEKENPKAQSGKSKSAGRKVKGK